MANNSDRTNGFLFYSSNDLYTCLNRKKGDNVEHGMGKRPTMTSIKRLYVAGLGCLYYTATRLFIINILFAGGCI